MRGSCLPPDSCGGLAGRQGLNLIERTRMTRIESNRLARMLDANLDLTDSEAEKFWPIYDQYTAELARINGTKLALIKEYARNYSSITSEQAEAYIKGRAAVEESVNRLRVKYLPIFRRVLSGKTTAIFFQIEWRVGLMSDLQLASQMPL